MRENTHGLSMDQSYLPALVHIYSLHFYSPACFILLLFLFFFFPVIMYLNSLKKIIKPVRQ